MAEASESRVLAAAMLEQWFRECPRFRQEGPHERQHDSWAWHDWRMERMANTPGFQNVCRWLAEYTDRLADPLLGSSTPLWLLSGSDVLVSESPETWTAAWVLCNKLQSRVGTTEETATDFVSKRHEQNIKVDGEAGIQELAARAEISLEKTGKGRRKKTLVREARRWTQRDLDAVIEAEIKKFSDTIAEAHKGAQGALKAIQKMFGRNALADRLGVKPNSRKMVSKSPAWRELAEQFGLRRQTHGPIRPSKRIGLAIAEEQAAQDVGDTTQEAVECRELVRLITDRVSRTKSKRGKAALQDIIDRLHRGEYTPKQAQDVLELYRGQQQDN